MVDKKDSPDWRTGNEIIDNFLSRVEARMAIAAKQPTVARTFNSETEIATALDSMNPEAAEAVRIAVLSFLANPAAMGNKEVAPTLLEGAMGAAIIRSRGLAIDELSMADLALFGADHELEITRVTTEILRFRLK